VTSLRHQLHVYSPGICIWFVEDSHLNSGRRKRPVFSQTRYSRVNVQKTGHCGRRTERKG